jgi:hypothetical protein
MPETPNIVLEIDDNTPVHLPPFTHDVSTWSFVDDLNLATRTAGKVFRDLHRASGSPEFRGYPERASPTTRELLGDARDVSWLTAAELAGERPWLPAHDPDDPVVKTLRMLFDTVDVVAGYFGAQRVRLVFSFSS